MATQAALETAIEPMRGKLTGEFGECFDFQCSGATLKNGWTIIWSEQEKFFDPPNAEALSKNFPLIVCWVNETIMHSRSMLFNDGKEQWMVLHEGDEDNFHIEYSGTPADDIDALIADARSHQLADPGVDYLFDVPLLIAQRLCGFKHDEMMEEEPVFHEIGPR